MRARKLASQERVHWPDGRPDGRSGEFARYQRIAPLYDLLDLPFEYGRYRALRRRMFEGLSGAILDAGMGTGRNMPFYPAGATVVGIDLSPAMLARAARRRERLGKQVALRAIDVRRTTFPDDSFDAVGCLRPVLRPGARPAAPSAQGARPDLQARRPDPGPGTRLFPGPAPALRHEAVGAPGAPGLRRRLRPRHRALPARGRARNARDPVPVQGHRQADRRPAGARPAKTGRALVARGVCSKVAVADRGPHRGARGPKGQGATIA